MRLATPLSNRTLLFLWLGAAALALGGFVTVTDEVLEQPEAESADVTILVAVSKLRRAWLNGPAVDITALGSPTLVTLGALMGFIVMLLVRDRMGALHLASAFAGAWILNGLTKNIFERARPTEVTHLVEVSSFSYPSGHSIAAAVTYVTLTVLACRHIRPLRARIALGIMAALIIALVAFSRVYLGVHYPTDVLSGVSLGSAWAFVLAAIFSRIERARRARGGPVLPADGGPGTSVAGD